MGNSEVRLRLIGVWDLIDYLIADKCGALNSLGPDVKGRLIYADSGHVSVVIARLPEKIKSLSDVIAYSGTFEVQDGQVVHSIEVSSIDRFYGKVLVRKIDWWENGITLSTVDRPEGQHQVSWKRVG